MILLFGNILRRRKRRKLSREVARLQFPNLSSTVKKTNILMSIELEVPVSIGSKPVVVPTVKNDGIFILNAYFRE